MSLVNAPSLKQKTPSVQTLGVLLFGLMVCVLPLRLWADCMPSGAGELAVVDRVYDGDTVRLEDGRHVRLLGINTPEVDHGGDNTAQALGEESRLAAEAFFKNSKQVRLFYDVQRVDRYERTLAHIYDIKGNSLAAWLLRKGFGFHVAIPPNLALNQCLHDQELIARKQSLGVWGSSAWRAQSATNLMFTDRGFRRVTGRVVNVYQSKSVWLELDGPLVIKIAASDAQNFPKENWKVWLGRRVEVRGWVTYQQRSTAKEKRSSREIPSPILVVQPRVAELLERLD